MATSVIQRSFAGGELSPAVYARTDLTKYQTGAKLLRNMFVLRHGGAANRAGTAWCGPTKYADRTTRIFRFKFNSTDGNSYAIEMGDHYMRIYALGGVVLWDPAAPVWSGATTYSIGDVVMRLGISYYCMVGNIGSNPELSPTIWYAMPTTGEFEIPTPYAAADLFGLQKSQSGDIITWVHESYDPYELRRFDVLDWVWVVVNFVPDTNRPTALAVSSGGAGALTFNFKVVAVRKDNFEQSLPATQAAKVITGATQANPVVITSAGHGFANSDEILHEAIVGMTELNGRTFVIANVAANTYELQNIDGTAYGAYVSGGTAKRTHAKLTGAATGTVAAPHVITWTAPSGDILEYDVYRQTNGRYGYIGTTSIPRFEDSGMTADVTDLPPSDRNPFFGTGNKPTLVTYVQQRLTFAATLNDPEKVFMSRTASFKNFTFRSPQHDDDSIIFPVVGKDISRIRQLLEIDKFIVITESGEFTIDGNEAGIVLPTAINPHQQGRDGSASIPSIAIGNSALYVQARGSIVRDYRYEIQSNNYNGRDLTVFAAHLFDNFNIVSWDYQQTPQSVVWAVRDDGIFLALTYLREHDVWGWAQCDTIGNVKDLCTIPENGRYGSEDFVYMIVERFINGQTVQYVERMASRKLKAENLVDDAFFVDAGIEYDGRNYAPTIQMQISLGSGWTVDDLQVITCTDPVFDAAEIGNQFVFFYDTYDEDDRARRYPITNTVRLDVIGFTDATHIQVRTVTDVPAVLQNLFTDRWARAVDTFSGLGHLAGEQVAVFAEGNTVVNGVDDQSPVMVSLAGVMELEECYWLVRAGLPIRAQMQTLDIDTVEEETLRDKQKLVGSVSLVLQDSRGFRIGPDLDTMAEFKQRDETDDWDNIHPFTGTEDIDIEHTWEGTGSFFVEQIEPLPLTILAVIPAVDIGG